MERAYHETGVGRNMGDLIENRFHPPGSWPWAMTQHRLGYTVRRPNGVRIPPHGSWSIGAQDAIAMDWEIAKE
jgi:hypothetical protein